LTRFQEHFRQYKIVVYHGLSCDDIMFQGRVDSSERLNLLYDDVERHYHVIVNLTAAMAQKYVCKGCNKACTSDVTHVSDQTCSDCATCPPCAFVEVQIPCDDCHRHVRSPRSFAIHKQMTSTQKSVCERKRRCENCGGWQVTSAKHECYKRFCGNCKENKDIRHLCYMKPLKDTLPARSDKVRTYSMILRRLRIQSTWTSLNYTYLISSARSSSAHDARTRKTETARYAVGGSTYSGKIPWGNCSYT